MKKILFVLFTCASFAAIAQEASSDIAIAQYAPSDVANIQEPSNDNAIAQEKTGDTRNQREASANTDTRIAREKSADTATLIFRTRGAPMNATFKTSTNEKPCEDLDDVGTVFDPELPRAKLLPFIAKLQAKMNTLADLREEIEKTVPAGIPLQISSKSTWYDRGNGSCGPLAERLTPEAGHKYLVMFQFAGGGCGQSITDITNAAEPAEVATQRLVCPYSFFSRW